MEPHEPHMQLNPQVCTAPAPLAGRPADSGSGYEAPDLGAAPIREALDLTSVTALIRGFGSSSTAVRAVFSLIAVKA